MSIWVTKGLYPMNLVAINNTNTDPTFELAKNTNLEPIPAAIPHSEPVKQARESEAEYKSLFDKVVKDPSTRNIAISSLNAILHGLAGITSFNENEQGSSLNKILDKSAFLLTRWIAPITSYGAAALNAWKRKDPVELFIKLLPPVLLPFIGDANIDAAYGMCSSLNQPYDMSAERVRTRAHHSQEHANFAQSEGNSFASNAKLIFDHYKELYRDLVNGKLDFWKEAIHLIGCPVIFASSLPILIFGRKDRNSTFNRVLGFARNIGGIMGDLGWMAGGNIYKKSIGTMFLTAALSSIAKRWCSDNVSKLFIHLSVALDLSANSLWNAFSEVISKKNSGVDLAGNNLESEQYQYATS